MSLPKMSIVPLLSQLTLSLEVRRSAARRLLLVLSRNTLWLDPERRQVEIWSVEIEQLQLRWLDVLCSVGVVGHGVMDTFVLWIGIVL